MFAIIKRYKKTSIVVFIALSVWLYHEFRPTIIFHTPQESKYLGKVSTFSGSIDIFHNIGCRIFGIGM